MVDSTSSSSDSDHHTYDTVKLLNSKRGLVRLAQIIKITRILKQFADKELDDHDKNLIKGIFVKKPAQAMPEKEIKENA